MNKKMILISSVMITIILGGVAIAVFGQKQPDIHALREDPSLFDASDYKDKVALHTRLSTLFPRGTERDNVDAFMAKAGMEAQQNDGMRCTYSTDFGTIRFMYGLNDNRLISLHILEGKAVWPEYRENCIIAAQELTPTTPQNETPIILPMQSLEIEP